MLVQQHENTLFNSLSYRIDNFILDPGDIWEGFNNASAVLLTHAHFDHIYGLNDLLRISPKARVFTNALGKEMLLDAKKNMSFYHETPFIFTFPENIIIVQDCEEVKLDNGIKAKAFFTPGHNASCITWQIEDYLFTGDAYIPGIKVITNLPGGNKTQAEESITRIKSISDKAIILPGHSMNSNKND